MQFDNEFEVAGPPADVIDKFADTPSMARLLPGASVGPANADGSYPATLLVSFGPKRLTFTGNITNTVDREHLSGVVTGHASADVRGAKLSVVMDYALTSIEREGRPATQVKLVSNAEMAGMLAEFARTGGVVVTNAILAEFALRFSEQFKPRNLDAHAAPATAEVRPLSAITLVGAVLLMPLRAAWRWLSRSHRSSH